MAPGAPGPLLSIEHEQLAPRPQAATHELAGRGQPGLPGPDDNDVDDLGGIGSISGVQVGIRGVHVTIMRHRLRLVRIGADAHRHRRHATAWLAETALDLAVCGLCSSLHASSRRAR